MIRKFIGGIIPCETVHKKRLCNRLSGGLFTTLSNIYGGTFSKNTQRLKAVSYVYNKALSKVFGRVLNKPLVSAFALLRSILVFAYF